MLLWLPKILTTQEVEHLRRIAASEAFVDGAASSPGLAAAGIKRNAQLAASGSGYRDMVQLVMAALDRNETFRTAAMPKITLPPILSRYRVGQGYGTHIDNPVRRKPVPMRLDLSMTLFLSDPATYQGGELIIETPYGEKSIKLPAGDAILYPTTMLHRVADIAAGERLAVVTWVQSMVQDLERRTLLYELTLATQWAQNLAPGDPNGLRLGIIRANLTRMWATD